MKKRFLVLSGLFWGTIALPAQNAHQLLRAGDQEYLRENYSAARTHYQDAIKQNPGSFSATYNLGCAEYKQGNYLEAEKAFQQAVTGAQLPATKADALYNLGNARLKQQKFRESIEAYENSLRLRPGDADTKQNLQMAKQKLQDEQKRQQQRQQQNGLQPPPDDHKQPPHDQPQSPQQPPQQENGQPQKPDKQSGQDGEQPPSPPTTPGQMTREEAQRTLETTIGPEDRKNARKYRAAMQQKKVPKTNKKDW